MFISFFYMFGIDHIMHIVMVLAIHETSTKDIAMWVKLVAHWM